MNSKSKTLGMPIGTANNRLKKSIIFHLLKRLNDVACFRCGKPIESVDDLTTDHKIEWEGVNAELFFDVNNIAFSHSRCNRPKIYGSTKRRKIGPIGTHWCCSCKQFLAAEEFNKDSSKWNGVQSYCRICFDLKRTKMRP